MGEKGCLEIKDLLLVRIITFMDSLSEIGRRMHEMDIESSLLDI